MTEKTEDLIADARREESIQDKLGDGFSEGSEERAFYYEHRDRYRRLADALEARQPSEDDREAVANILSEHGAGTYLSMADAVLAAGFSRAAVPDAATDIARNLANATALTGQDARVIAEAAVLLAAAGEIAEDHARCDGRLLSVEKHAERMEAERDAALAAIERVRAVLAKERARHEHLVESGDAAPRTVIGIGKVEAALDGAPEPEEGDAEYQAGCGSWDCRAPECGRA